MAKVGRPKLVENMTEHEKRCHFNRQGMAALTEEQQKAVDKTKDALGSFVSEWTESFDIYDPETPRKLQQAFWAMRNAFGSDE